MRTPVAPLSDETLLAQMAAGDRTAMRALFARHQVKVYRFILRIVRDAALADDAVSETFFDAWQHAGCYAGRSSVTTWLLGIARHKALSLARRRPTEPLDGEAAEAIVDPAGDPGSDLDRKQTGAMLRRALAALSRDHAEVIDLVYYQERSVGEAAQILGVPEGTVKTRMFHARRQLATLVAAEGIARAAA